MKKILSGLLFMLNVFISAAQFAPPAGQSGTTAIHKDSSVFVAWATGCTLDRGYQDISNPLLGFTSAGDSTFALDKAGVNGTISLGDGGSAILTFDKPITDGSGWDFAVFENSFSDYFLELAFVEVSSDGINYFRFPSTSNIQDTIQVGSFDSTDATKINNLAGKYRALYGTPFDLQELSGQAGLDVNLVTHIKIIDVVGCIQNSYATYDFYGKKINDPWNTPFPSGGFDLDAVGVIHQAVTGVDKHTVNFSHLNIYPNPVNSSSILKYYNTTPTEVNIRITDLSGKEIASSTACVISGWHSFSFSDVKLNNGLYFISLQTKDEIINQKIIVCNEQP